MDISGIYIDLNSNTFNARHFICLKYRWDCVPVFRPNIGKISVAAFWAAIGRAALLLAEAACPTTPGISANHWPPWSHSWLIKFTKNVSSENLVSATVNKTLWIRPQLVGSGFRCSRVIHVKSPEKQRESPTLRWHPSLIIWKKVEEDTRPQKIHCGLFAFDRQFRLCTCPFLPSKAFTLKPVINRISYQVLKGLLVVKRKLKSCKGRICLRAMAEGIVSHTKNLLKFSTYHWSVGSSALEPECVKKILVTAYHRHACVASSDLYIAALQIGAGAHQIFRN